MKRLKKYPFVMTGLLCGIAVLTGGCGRDASLEKSGEASFANREEKEQEDSRETIPEEEQKESHQTVVWEDLQKTGSLELSYATQFTADYYDGGYILTTVAQTGTYLVVPGETPVPEGLPEEITVVQQPCERIYLGSSSVMDLYRALDEIPKIRFSSLKQSEWYIEEAVTAMEQGDMMYAGKYSSPDYEQILAKGCDLAIENTMIFHSPEVKEKLEQLGIPVIVERSSYESHPLGRLEWIKFYGLLMNKEEEAANYFAKQEEQVKQVIGQEPTGKSVVFFAINGSGTVTVRKAGDYVAKMIALAGGEYVFDTLTGEDSLSTMNIAMESFYAQAKDADILIYNSTIDGELESLEDLLSKSELLADFKAVQNGAVWCTTRNMFQQSTCISQMIVDMHTVFTNPQATGEDCTYLYRIQ